MSTLAVEQTTLEGLEANTTLDDLIVSVWRTVSSHREVECPICHGVMEPQYGAHALPVGARCIDCGSLLS